MKITKEMVMKNAKNVLTVVSFAAVATAAFQLGTMYQSGKKEQVAIENPYAHAFSPEDISIAVNESGELIMILRTNGKYIVYSDAIGQTIFRMYANRIHQEANGIK